MVFPGFCVWWESRGASWLVVKKTVEDDSWPVRKFNRFNRHVNWTGLCSAFPLIGWELIEPWFGICVITRSSGNAWRVCRTSLGRRIRRKHGRSLPWAADLGVFVKSLTCFDASNTLPTRPHRLTKDNPRCFRTPNTGGAWSTSCATCSPRSATGTRLGPRRRSGPRRHGITGIRIEGRPSRSSRRWSKRA